MSKEEISTKMQIVNQSIELFKKNGFSNVSVKQICETVGITRSAFYYHFKTKDEIFDYYLLIPEIYISEHIITLLEAPDYRTQFFKIFELFLQRIVEVGPEIVRFVFKRNIDAYVHNIAPTDIAMWQVYVDLIKKAQDNGEISKRMDPENMVKAIIYLCNGIGLTWCNNNGNFDYVEENKRLVELLLKRE